MVTGYRAVDQALKMADKQLKVQKEAFKRRRTLAVSSQFAILDVEDCRAELATRIYSGEKFDVVIRGTITEVWGNDDGTSQEFQVDVEELEVKPARKARKR